MRSLIGSNPTGRLLVDRRTATAPSRQFVERMASFLERNARQLDGWRTAVVAGDDAGYGVGRMMQLTTEARQVAVQIRVFRTCEEAERWLETST